MPFYAIDSLKRKSELDLENKKISSFITFLSEINIFIILSTK